MRMGVRHAFSTNLTGEALYFNDSVVGPDGAVYVGTYYWDAQGMRKYGKLYRIAKNSDVRVLDEGNSALQRIGIFTGSYCVVLFRFCETVHIPI